MAIVSIACANSGSVCKVKNRSVRTPQINTTTKKLNLQLQLNCESLILGI